MDDIGNGAENPEGMRKNLLKSFTDFEKLFRKQYPVIWISTLLAPIVVTAIVLGILYFANGSLYVGKVLSHAGLTFFVFGRFIILLGMSDKPDTGHDISMEPYELFAMVTYMDFITALFVAFHMGFLFKLPWVGEKIAALVWDGKFLMEKQPWIKKISYIGLVAFVIFPTSTTGSIGGSIFGRLLGLSRLMTVSGVLLGSLLGNALMLAFSQQINQWIDPKNVWLKIVGVLIIVALFVMLEFRYRSMKKRHFGESMESNSKPGEANGTSNDANTTNSALNDLNEDATSPTVSSDSNQSAED